MDAQQELFSTLLVQLKEEFKEKANYIKFKYFFKKV